MNEIEHNESRRNFMSTHAKLIPTVALASAATLMSAQSNAQTPAADAPLEPGFTADKIQGIPVITELHVDKLEAGKTHRFWFQGASNAAGQYWYVPVIVVKGKNPGKTLGVQAVVHGDEINGVKVIQKLTAELKPEELSGALVAVPTANITGLLSNNRNWQHNTDGGSTTDFNRVWPGKMEGGSVAEQHAYLLFHKLWKNNVNAFVDLHTQSRGTVYPLMLYVDPRHAGAKKMAELIPADQVKNDDGDAGTTELVFIEIDIPAITMEIGAPKVYQPELIDRALIGLRNLLSHYKIINAPIGQTSKEANTFFGNEMVSVRAEVSGFADILVNMGDMVTKGQLIALQRNVFGDIIKEYHAPNAGKVLSFGTDPVRESRSLLVRILYNS